MRKDKALYNWWQQFGIPFYPTTALPPAVNDTSVPENERLTFPYGTYEPFFGGYGDNVAIAVNLYYLTESEAVPNAKADEIGKAIDDNGIIECDEGAMWVKKGSPFVQGLLDPDNRNIKRRYIQIIIEFLTNE
jgi:hypothetical protein